MALPTMTSSTVHTSGMTTLRVSLVIPSPRPGEGPWTPQPGDLLVIKLRPGAPQSVAPPGWTEGAEGMFWKWATEHEPLEAVVPLVSVSHTEGDVYIIRGVEPVAA